MSGYRVNELTLYLRPIENQPPYQIHNCANWLVKKRYAKNFTIARLWLDKLLVSDVWRFKSLMSAYYADTDYKSKELEFKDVNSYRTSKSNIYGDELHMYKY